MIKINNILTALCIALLPLLWSCETNSDLRPAAPEGSIGVRLLTRASSDGMESANESTIHDLKAFRFEENSLKEVFGQLTTNEDGICYLQPHQMRGTVYFIANTSAFDLSDIRPEVTTLNEFLNLKASSESMCAEGISMTGHLELSATMPSQISVSMKRSVARIDLDASFENVEVHSVTIKNIAATGYINPNAETNPADKETRDWKKTFDTEPFKSRKDLLTYLCEQGQGSHEVEIIATIQGAWHRLHTALPAIKRNKVYTLKVYGNGANAKVEVLTDEWENGISSSSDLEQKGWIDKENSLLPQGVTISEKGDTVYIPYTKSDMQLALLSEEGIEVQVNGRIEGTTIAPHSSRNAGTQQTIIAIAKPKYMPGSMQEYVYLDLYKQQVLKGRIVLTFAPNPLSIIGNLKFDANSVCDYQTYIDGKLAELSIGNGMTLDLKSKDEGPIWAKLYQDEQSNTYSLEGGWKPNDPRADGRVQTVELLVKDKDGNQVDSYTIKRRYWTLPVVNINGTWWCKYNLRGNVKNFEDQILLANDPVKDGSLADYLTSCTDEQFLDILGDQYQGGNPQGLKLSYDGKNFFYEGFQNNAQDFGALKVTEMAPPGYEIPDYNDFRFFAWNNDSGLGYGSGAFNNKVGDGNGERINYTSKERIATFKGGNYGPIHFYDFSHNNAHCVMLGLGHQWEASAGSIFKMMILMATSGVPGNSWVLEGYATNASQKGTTWIKYMKQNSIKTRTIRCIKSEVRYIYE